MFHCNGWCFPWSLSLVIGTHVCLRWVRAKAVFDAIVEHNVTHMCGAPTVMGALLNAGEDERRPLPHEVQFAIAAVPPPEAVLAAMTEAGFNATHVYGLTESYGPAVVNEWKAEWDELDTSLRAAKKARQGVRYAPLEDLTVMDPATMTPVPADGATMGEVMMRGNIIMKGYLKNPKATEEAFALARLQRRLRRTEAAPIFAALRDHGVSHFCGAPIVLNMLGSADAAIAAMPAQQITR